ncbi:MAG: hypothetical protein MUF00_05390, partial [Gemmatimonadaceae bacterium]|nr:hypothetical protein [Gemmatimonadaceae bacterium]
MNVTRIVRAALVPTVLVLLWALVTTVGRVDALFVPSPAAVARALRDGIVDGPLLAHAGATVRRAGLGFVIAVCLGAPLGLAIGRSARLDALLSPTIDFLRAIPPTALLPLFTLLFAL